MPCTSRDQEANSQLIILTEKVNKLVSEIKILKTSIDHIQTMYKAPVNPPTESVQSPPVFMSSKQSTVAPEDADTDHDSSVVSIDEVAHHIPTNNSLNLNLLTTQ